MRWPTIQQTYLQVVNIRITHASTSHVSSQRSITCLCTGWLLSRYKPVGFCLDIKLGLTFPCTWLLSRYKHVGFCLDINLGFTFPCTDGVKQWRLYRAGPRACKCLLSLCFISVLHRKHPCRQSGGLEWSAGRPARRTDDISITASAAILTQSPHRSADCNHTLVTASVQPAPLQLADQ